MDLSPANMRDKEVFRVRQSVSCRNSSRAAMASQMFSNYARQDLLQHLAFTVHASYVSLSQ